MQQHAWPGCMHAPRPHPRSPTHAPSDTHPVHTPPVQVKSHLQRYRTAYVADCLARGEVVDVSEAQLRASQALLEKRAAGGGSARPAATSSRRRPASSMQRSDGSSPPPSQQRQRPRSDSAGPTPMATDGGGGSVGRPAPRQAHGFAAAAVGTAGRPPVVRASGSGEGCDTAVSNWEQGSEPLPSSSLARGERGGQPGGSAGTAAAAAAAAGAPALGAAPPAGMPQQGGAVAKLEILLARLQQLHMASDLLVVQMQEQQRQHQRAWLAMQQALEALQRECAVSCFACSACHLH